MSTSILSSTPRATTIQHGFNPDEIRAFIAEYIGVDCCRWKEAKGSFPVQPTVHPQDK
jgi:hypothetical protein